MGITKFFSDALGSAVSLGLATHDDVLRHATPDVLAKHLPRPLWSKLITACLASPRTDARLVVETITMPVLCEHVPPVLLWACLEQIGKRSLDKAVTSAASMPAPAAAASVITSAAPSTPSPTPVSSSTPPVGTSSLPPPPASPRATATVGTVATPGSAVPTPIGVAPSQPVMAPRLQTSPVVPTSAVTPPHGTNITNSRVPTVGAGAATRRTQGGPPTGRPGGPPSPPPKSARAETEQPVVDVDDAQVIDFGHAEETFVGRGDAEPKR